MNHERTTMSDTYVLERRFYKPTDSRLGRHVNHDSRSLLYPVQADPINSLKSIKHKRNIPVLDQGKLGSCTGNAAVGCLGTGVFWDTVKDRNVLSIFDAAADENYAIDVYSASTSIDAFNGQYPPTDTGSDGLSVAKVLQSRELISGYQHATSLEAVLTALSTQPVIIGTEWDERMFEPGTDGRIFLGGSTAGGHEYVLDELDVEDRRVWMCNSWGIGWGINGRAYLNWDDLDHLLHRQGDCTVFTPVTQPAPTPVPPPAPPAPPEPAPVPTPDADFRAAAVNFKAALDKFLNL